MLDESVFREARLCVVGGINRDIKTSPIEGGNHLFFDGETSIEAIHETIGGGGANSAAIAANLGARSALIGLVGDDETGRRVEQALTRAGVVSHLSKRRDVATGTTVNLVFQSGQRHFLSSHPNNRALSYDDLDLRALTQSTHLLRADVWFSEAMLFGGNERLLRAAREAGLATSLDLNWDPMWGHAPDDELRRRKEAVRGVLPWVDLAHGNIRELNEFTGEGELSKSLSRLKDWGVGAVAVHMANEGSGYFDGARLVIEPPASVAQPMVATGTGDVLSVCLMLMHHCKDIAAAEKLRLANQVVAGFMEGRRALIPTL